MSERFACKVCGNVPDAEGNLEHGKGCYTQSADGGGDEYIEEADRSLEAIERRLRETVEQATGGQWTSRGVVGSHAELNGPGGHGALGFLHEPDDLGDYAVDQQFLADLAHIAAACPDNIRVVLAELDRLRAENAAYWRAVVALEEKVHHPTGGDQLSRLADLAACMEVLVAIRKGNSYAHIPEPAVKLALEREEKLAGELAAVQRQVRAYQTELAEVEQTLGVALGYPVDVPEVGGAGTGVMAGVCSPATLAAKAARELGRLYQRVAEQAQRLAATDEESVAALNEKVAAEDRLVGELAGKPYDPSNLPFSVRARLAEHRLAAARAEAFREAAEVARGCKRGSGAIHRPDDDACERVATALERRAGEGG